MREEQKKLAEIAKRRQAERDIEDVRKKKAEKHIQMELKKVEEFEAE